MTKEALHILIFKTNIQTYIDARSVAHSLDTNETVLQWNIDQKDRDCVLRIVSLSPSYEAIINLINNCGFECTELV